MRFLRGLLLGTAAFGALVATQLAIDASPEKIETVRANPYQELPPTDYLTEYLGTMLIGGFKPIAVDFLWMRCTTLEEQKQFQEIKTILSLISRLQPWSEQVWSYIAWNLAFNIAHQAATPEERWRWVSEGILTAKEGARRNPGSFKLKHDVGFLYYYRVPQQKDLKRRVYAETQLDCYEHARNWFQMAKSQAEGSVGRRYEFDSFILDCLLHHIFEAASRHQYEEALSSAASASSYARSIATTYGQHILFWERRGEVPTESVPALESERAMWEAEQRGDLEAAARYRVEAFGRYAMLLRRFNGLNLGAVEDRMEELLEAHVIGEAFPRCDRGEVAGAQAALDWAIEVARQTVPADHFSYPYWMGTAQQWVDFKSCLTAEVTAQAATLAKSPDAAAKWTAAVEQYKYFGENYAGTDIDWLDDRHRLIESRALAAGAVLDAPSLAPPPPPPPPLPKRR
ncbi:MAG: hypothetical protein HYY93_15955 [Planctomycetes bacterium]|nr:hypothetical protein [Planctomycetota bacterium]